MGLYFGGLIRGIKNFSKQADIKMYFISLQNQIHNKTRSDFDLSSTVLYTWLINVFDFKVVIVHHGPTSGKGGAYRQKTMRPHPTLFNSTIQMGSFRFPSSECG